MGERDIQMGDFSFSLSKEQEKKLAGVLGKTPREIDFGPVDAAYAGFENLIKLCGDDPDRNGLQDTPFRVIKAFAEYSEGYREDPSLHLEKTFEVDHHELVMVKDIEFHSMCEHHFAPFHGVAHVGYIPRERITGLSKIARVVDGYAKRFQVQERLTNQIADALVNKLDPIGAMVVIEAKHMCMCGRGIKKSGASTTTSAVRGAFKKETAARAEFLSLMNR